MNDQELTAIVPAWSKLSKSKREKLYREYQHKSNQAASWAEASAAVPASALAGTNHTNESTTPDQIRTVQEWTALERRATSLERVRLLSLLGPYIDHRNASGIHNLFHGESFDDFLRPLPVNHQNQLCFQIWECAGPALLRSLDFVDTTTKSDHPFPIMTLTGHLSCIWNELLQRVGRAASAVQRTCGKSFATTCLWVLQKSCTSSSSSSSSNSSSNSHNHNSNPAEGSRNGSENTNQHSSNAFLLQLQFYTLKQMVLLMYQCPLAFYMNLKDSGLILATVNILDKSTDSSIVDGAGRCIELFAMWSYRHGRIEDDRSLFRRAHTIASLRLLRAEIREDPPSPGTMDVSEILGPMSSLLLMLTITCKLPVTDRVITHIRPFGEKYTDVMPTDPLERHRWSPRYHVKNLCSKDWMAPMHHDDGIQYVESIASRFQQLDQQRRSLLRCAYCHRIEEDEPHRPSGDNGTCCDGPNSMSWEAEHDKTTQHDRTIKLNKCSRCRNAYYCDSTCQRAHWPVHKHDCSILDQDPIASILLRVYQMNNSTDRAGSHHAKGGNKWTYNSSVICYPCLFAVWLDYKLNNNSSTDEIS